MASAFAVVFKFFPSNYTSW